MMSESYPDHTVGPGSPYTLEQWRETYRHLKNLANEMLRLLNVEARRMCADAALSPDLLGIHPNNAMCGLEHGHPWEGVDYNRVRICLDLLRIQFDAHRLVDALDKAVRGAPHRRKLEEWAEAERREREGSEAA
jgi:hypothetical protein